MKVVINPRKKVDPFSRDHDVLSNTIMKMIGTHVTSPMSMRWMMDCLNRFPFSVTIHFDKIFGRYLVSNEHMDRWKDETRESFYSGANFTVIDTDLEMAMARAIHYYYHWQERKDLR